MNITATTTDAELWAPITAAKQRLVDSVGGNDDSSESLSGRVNEVARAEGEAEVNYLLRNALAHGATVEEIERALLQCALRSADDTFSGRTNDSRRAKRDGLVSRVRDLTQFDGIRKIVEAQA